MNLVTPDIGLIFWQTVTFLIVLFLLAKFAWKPITDGLKERENTIGSIPPTPNDKKPETQGIFSPEEAQYLKV